MNEFQKRFPGQTHPYQKLKDTYPNSVPDEIVGICHMIPDWGLKSYIPPQGVSSNAGNLLFIPIHVYYEQTSDFLRTYTMAIDQLQAENFQTSKEEITEITHVGLITLAAIKDFDLYYKWKNSPHVNGSNYHFNVWATPEEITLFYLKYTDIIDKYFRVVDLGAKTNGRV